MHTSILLFFRTWCFSHFLQISTLVTEFLKAPVHVLLKKKKKTPGTLDCKTLFGSNWNPKLISPWISETKWLSFLCVQSLCQSEYIGSVKVC